MKGTRTTARPVGILDHDEIEAIKQLNAGDATRLATLLRHKFPLSAEMQDQIAAMLANDGRSAWQLMLKRRQRGRPSKGERPANLLPLTLESQRLIAAMLSGEPTLPYVLVMRRQKAGNIAAPFNTASKAIAIGELMAQLLGEGTADFRDELKVAAHACNVELVQVTPRSSRRFKARQQRLTRLKVRPGRKKEALALVALIFGLGRSSIEAAYNAYCEGHARLTGK